MSAEEWRTEAERRFPRLKDAFDRADSSYQLWHELLDAFYQAYDLDDTALVAEIYEYAGWCCLQPEGRTASDDLGTCVVVCFFEHIPQHAKALADMPRWWSMREVLVMKQIFGYTVGDEGYARILEAFRDQPEISSDTRETLWSRCRREASH